ncbi:MAG: 2-polyprenyl-3-methyl-6-methoxy-1,4-benzoquinone monooxygenase [Gammaproteobacteria bacterium]|nr:2-polyprenyl-3-methyl-6-methoxy-1,4-benzoquinone monooxygenase [Gammaproteobacteria bacterium]
MNMQNFSDRLIAEFDRGLRTLTKSSRSAQRANPAETIEENDLSENDAQLSGRLMRVNHAGEIAAQGLYHGQALTAKDNITLTQMKVSAKEEEDHLAWCEQRLNDLQTPRSLISPLWYIGSYTIGATAGLFGDRWSLGFVAETEDQVEKHLDNHLQKLPSQDKKSRAIIEKMKADEQQHGQAARDLGGHPLPAPVQKTMQLVSKVMTTGAYWI